MAWSVKTRLLVSFLQHDGCPPDPQAPRRQGKPRTESHRADRMLGFENPDGPLTQGKYPGLRADVESLSSCPLALFCAASQPIRVGHVSLHPPLAFTLFPGILSKVHVLDST